MSRFDYRDGRYWCDGMPWFVIASDYQYYRDRREHWPDRLGKLRDAGVNVITFYTPWRHHLRQEGDRRCYDFTGATKDSRDLVGFLKLVESMGLKMIVKPGPFVHSELNVGGLPDLVSPSFNAAMPAAERHHGGPAYWCYDASKLPAPMDETFDALCAEWLWAVGQVVRPHAGLERSIIGIQLNDETIFCMSNDPPWNVGYDAPGMRFYRRLVAERYGDIDTYNRLHGTAHKSWDQVSAPRPCDPPNAGAKAKCAPDSVQSLLRYVDWGEYHWRFRRDLYVRYAEYFGVEGLPYLTNYAGITPPIEENVPNLQKHAAEPIPADYRPLYPEWWFAANRIDHDRDAYHYGMISWLGVAAYDRDVFDRYVNTARRARGINMEENWGFGTLYDARSRDPIVPFFQTLVSVAAGATGYDIFVGVGTEYWDETLDRITKLQCPTFPSHAPIDEHGNLRPMYHTMVMLNRWFAEHGQALLRCETEMDCAYLLYAPYAAISSWIPDERYWQIADAAIPRCGREGFEEFSRSLQAAGYSFGMFELDAATERQMRGPRSLAMHCAAFMDADAQERLASFIEQGGRLFLSGELPTMDLRWQPCSRLRDAVNRAVGNVVYQERNLFAEGTFAGTLAEHGIHTKVRCSENLRAFVHRGPEDQFVFFFNLDAKGRHEKAVEFDGQRLELYVGAKTSGVVRIHLGELMSWLVKGVNEVEGITADVRIEFNGRVVEGCGDFSSVS